MLKNYLILTFRSLARNKGFGWLNIMGLAIGIACAALIFLWVEDELKFDHVFANRDRLYRVMENQHDNNGEWTTSHSTPGPMAAAVKKELPGVRESARLSWGMGELFAYQDKSQSKGQDRSIKANGLYADPSLPGMLLLTFVHGGPATALQLPQSVLISEGLARRIFGDENPMGKTLAARAGQGYSVDGVYTVTGVFRDLPANASFNFQWLSPYSVFEEKNPWLKPWNNNLTETLVELDPQADLRTIDKKLKGYLGTKVEGSGRECWLFSMNDWHLRGHFANGQSDGGAIRYVKLFALIAGIILLIACINFMNLATARSEQRAREVGVRKVLGAGRGMLMRQFLGESMFLSFVAVALAIAILVLALPAFNQLVGKTLTVGLSSPAHVAFLLLTGLVCGLVAGSYPAVYLSSFRPAGVLKGWKATGTGAAAIIRKGLVVTQFSAGIVFIICTVIIYQQVSHIRGRDLGYNKDNLITMNMQGSLKDHFSAVRQDLLSTGAVENAAMSLFGSLQVNSSFSGLNWQGKDPRAQYNINTNIVTPEYISTMNMKLEAGRDFSEDVNAESANVLISRSFAKLMGAEGRVGGIVTLAPNDFHIIGIVGDLVYNDMYAAPEPMVFSCSPNPATLLTIRLKKGVGVQEALAKVQTVIEKDNPGYPFEYQFVDEAFGKLFSTEMLAGKLTGVFAVLAILIACLGLFSLAAHMAERRTKEIGIRKVLGASVARLAAALSAEFLLLVVVACLIAFPIGWWAMNLWLKGYAYRTTIHWWVFGGAGVGAMLIALLTLGWQTLKAASANPIMSLRAE